MNWIGFRTLTFREVGRFFAVWRQTIVPGLISSILYILIFGFTLEKRIDNINGIPYTLFILPGLIMMNALTNATSNSSSSMLQMKLLGQLPDILQAPLSSFEISMAYIIGGTVRGTINGILILLVGVALGDMVVVSPVTTMQNFILTPLSFLGGIFYSIKMLPDWAQSLSLFNPIYYMINGLRFTILGISDSNPSHSFIIAILMTVVFTTASIKLMESGKKIKQ